MKPVFTFIALLFCTQLFACNKSNELIGSINDTSNTGRMKLKITVGSNTFSATVYNNATSTAFISTLPFTINMKELNGNEKYLDLQNSLPTNAANSGTIQARDLMLYGSNTLVLFYKTFSTPYNYTKLAGILNPSGLAAALGSGNITVKFEVEYNKI